MKVLVYKDFTHAQDEENPMEFNNVESIIESAASGWLIVTDQGHIAFPASVVVVIIKEKT